MSHSLCILESPELLKFDPLTVLRTLRDHEQRQHNYRSIALFRTCVPREGPFVPELTIIGVRPAEVIQCKNGTITHASASLGAKKIKANPFDYIHQRLAEKKITPDPRLPFFQSGALGYFGYDSVRFLEPTLAQNKFFQNQNEFFEAEIVFFESYLIFDVVRNKVFLIAEHQADRDVSVQLKEIEKIALSQSTRPLAPFAPSADLALSEMNKNLGKSGYLDGIAKLKFHILEGDIFQTVLSDQFSTPYQGDPFTVFEALTQTSLAPYQFFFEIDGRAFMGASPEMLLKCMEGRIETHPIAGTRPRGKTPEEERIREAELLADPKEKSEHLMLVDLARNDLGRVSKPGTVRVDQFEKIKKFAGVMHLVSEVSGQIKPELSGIQALGSCFPAGTLSGAPKIKAMDLITEIEKIPRGFYGGAFVAASLTGDLDSCINIRSISIENSVARIQVGAGIVADSVPEMEYQEIEHKSRLTRKALALAKSVLPREVLTKDPHNGDSSL